MLINRLKNQPLPDTRNHTGLTAQEESGLDSTPTLHACFVRIDHLWRKIGNLVDEFRAKRYPQLAKPAHCVMETAFVKEVSCQKTTA